MDETSTPDGGQTRKTRGRKAGARKDPMEKAAEAERIERMRETTMAALIDERTY